MIKESLQYIIHTMNQENANEIPIISKEDNHTDGEDGLINGQISMHEESKIECQNESLKPANKGQLLKEEEASLESIPKIPKMETVENGEVNGSKAADVMKGICVCESRNSPLNAGERMGKVEEIVGQSNKALSSGTTKITTDLMSHQDLPEKIVKEANKNYLMQIGIHKKNRKLFQILNCSAKDCFICNSKSSQRKVIQSNLSKKYLTSRDSYNAKVINDIVYNESTRIVCIFKDYLIYDDTSEFLKRFYANHESAVRLPKVYDYYDKYSQVFPNYVVLPENKFMFKNIERKQRVIDEQQKVTVDTQKKKHNPKEEEKSLENMKLLTTVFLKELNQDNINEGKEEELMQSNNKKEKPLKASMASYLKDIPKENASKVIGKFDTMDLHDLVSNFIAQDTQSMIDISQAIKTANENEISKTNETNEQKLPQEENKSKNHHERAKSQVNKPVIKITPLSVPMKQMMQLNGEKARIGSRSNSNKAPSNKPAKKEVWSVAGTNAESSGSQYSTLRSNYVSPFAAPMIKQGKKIAKPRISDKVSQRQNLTPVIGREPSKPNCAIPKQKNIVSARGKEAKLLSYCSAASPEFKGIQQIVSMSNNPKGNRMLENRSSSRNNRNNGVQMACLQDIYQGKPKSIIPKVGRNQNGLAIYTQGTTKNNPQGKLLTETNNTHKFTKPSTQHYDPNHKFKSDFLNTLQKKHETRCPTLVPHAIIQSQPHQKSKSATGNPMLQSKSANKFDKIQPNNGTRNSSKNGFYPQGNWITKTTHNNPLVNP